MSNKVTVELCPETGICSIVREGGQKTDLMPGEVAALRAAAGDPAKVRAAIGEADADFAKALSESDLRQVASSVGR